MRRVLSGSGVLTCDVLGWVITVPDTTEAKVVTPDSSEVLFLEEVSAACSLIAGSISSAAIIGITGKAKTGVGVVVEVKVEVEVDFNAAPSVISDVDVDEDKLSLILEAAAKLQPSLTIIVACFFRFLCLSLCLGESGMSMWSLRWF